MLTVYVLYSENFEKHYTGFTSNFEQRLLSHNVLGKGWTKKYWPWKVLLTDSYETKSEAMQRERWLKTGVGRDFIKQLEH